MTARPAFTKGCGSDMVFELISNAYCYSLGVDFEALKGCDVSLTDCRVYNFNTFGSMSFLLSVNIKQSAFQVKQMLKRNSSLKNVLLCTLRGGRMSEAIAALKCNKHE